MREVLGSEYYLNMGLSDMLMFDCEIGIGLKFGPFRGLKSMAQELGRGGTVFSQLRIMST